MYIVHCESSCGWGGQEIRILSEAQGLIERGHRLALVCPRSARIYDEARAIGLPVTALPIDKKRYRGFVALRRWLAAEKPDLINSHSSTDSWLAALARLGLKARPALVRTRHVSAPVRPDPGSHWLYHQAAMTVTTGISIKAHLMSTLALADDRVVSIPTGIDGERFYPGSATQKLAARQALGLPLTAHISLIVATLRSWKGHRHAISAFMRAREAGDRLLIVGDGPQRQALSEQITALGSDCIDLVGNQDDVVPWLHASDLFILPSYANEGVPQALLQAMFCALPCLTTDVGGIPEVAREGETAVVVRAKDSEAIANGWLRLRHDAALCRQLGDAARTRASTLFSRSAMLDQMLAVFERSLTSGPPGGPGLIG